MISTLIKTLTASDSAYLDFVDGTASVVLDSTYDHYMFVCTDIRPEVDSSEFMFQVNATDDAGGSYDNTITSSTFEAIHNEDGSGGGVAYSTGADLAQGTGFQTLAMDIGNGADESCAGILHLFKPASTTYVKHFYAEFSGYQLNNYAIHDFAAGYINDTTAIDEIRFKMSSDNFTGVIQLYGIA